MARKVIVVGASSGMGKELSLLHLEAGDRVAMVARREKILGKIAAPYLKDKKNTQAIVLKHDVSDPEKAGSVFSKAVKTLGGLDRIYFCAGVMPSVGPDEFDTKKDLDMLRTNLLGCVAWLNPAAELFQSQGEGEIVGISSIAGDRGRRGNPVYNTSKSGMNTYLEALRNRLGIKGVTVTTVKPGFIDTDMTKGLPGLFWLISAREAAETIMKKVNRKKESFYVPARWAFVGLIIRMIPSFLFKRLSI